VKDHRRADFHFSQNRSSVNATGVRGMSADFLEFRNISKVYPGVKALQDVSFSVAKGAVHGLMGENGAGKSTLIKILSGDQKATAGEIAIDQVEQHYFSTRDAFGAGVIVIHQELQLVPELSVAENLRLGRFPNRSGVIDFAELARYVGEKLKEIGVDVDPKEKIVNLSIGQRQMVEIAKSVMLDARVIALDEPTSSLSSRESEVLFALIGKLSAEGKVILYVSHRMDEIFRLCTGMTVLRDGKVAAHHPSMEGLTRDKIVAEMVGREISDIWGWRARHIREPLLKVSHLSGPKLITPISYEVRSGEILGFFGLVGAGRSEMTRLVAGVDRRYGGTVDLAGRTVPPDNPHLAIAAGIVLCPEDRKFDGIIQGRSIEENTLISSRRHSTSYGVLNLPKEAEVAETFIKKLRVRTPSRKQDIVNLSGGNQQKVILARWLSEQGVKAMIVDEPTRGIDVGAKAEIFEILYELAEAGMAIVVVSSDLSEVMGITDRVLVMCEGHITLEINRADYNDRTILAAALPDKSTKKTFAA
jgi:L-arabinose transport system ATP-binding protein